MTSDPDVIANRYRKRDISPFFLNSWCTGCPVTERVHWEQSVRYHRLLPCSHRQWLIKICIKIAAYMDVGTVREIAGGSIQAFSPTVANISLSRLLFFQLLMDASD